jgi:ABC-type nitrate/sulfonate/bicarbonate transport system permease component
MNDPKAQPAGAPAAAPPAAPAEAQAPAGAPPAPQPPPPPVDPAAAEAALRAFESEDSEQKPAPAPRAAARATAPKAAAPKAEAQAAAPASGESSWLAPFKTFWRSFFEIRNEPTLWGRLFMAALCIGLIFLAWWLATRAWWGPNGNERAIDAITLGSPEEVFGSFGSLWFDRALMRNLFASLRRVLEGFGLAVAVGVPLGILGGTFVRIDAFFAPISIFGRNVPIAALVPLSMLFFGIDEAQKIAFIFIACVAFIMFDASRAVRDVGQDYLDTAYTLGASRWQVLLKVIVPLALPDIFNSVRLLFGLAFGYIIMAEIVNATEGIGMLILNSQRRGPKEHVYLILLFITLVAFLFDRGLWFTQKALFPYRHARR